jgi:hypothetical protein
MVVRTSIFEILQHNESVSAWSLLLLISPDLISLEAGHSIL